jgi:hypothetical protein
MAHHEKDGHHEHEHMGGKHHAGKHHGLGKKESGFGAKLGKMKGKTEMEGPHHDGMHHK